MGEKQNAGIPKQEVDYTVKYVFDEKSEVDVNEVLKKCFLNEINDKNTVHHSI